jgi:hypothetical protein
VDDGADAARHAHQILHVHHPGASIQPLRDDKSDDYRESEARREGNQKNADAK